MSKAALNILIVDDEPSDQLLETIALSEQPFDSITHCVGSAAAAIEYLDNVTQRNTAPPDILLLDGHLMEKPALEILDHVKGHEKLRDIHVIILTGVISLVDQECFLHHGADSILEKSADFNDLIQTLAFLERYARAA